MLRYLSICLFGLFLFTSGLFAQEFADIKLENKQYIYKEKKYDSIWIYTETQSLRAVNAEDIEEFKIIEGKDSQKYILISTKKVCFEIPINKIRFMSLKDEVISFFL